MSNDGDEHGATADRGGNERGVIDRAADWLRAGRIVAFPTETVYGLGANALDERAVACVFALKGRPANNPLIVHVRDAVMARGVCGSWPERADRLAERFWPGPLTLVLPRSSVVPAVVAGGGVTVAVRVPDHRVALALIERFGGPIVGPSANRSGMVSPTTAAHVLSAFGHDERVMVLDGGACRSGIESTVVSLAGPVARVLRRGAVTPESIAAALGEAVEDASGVADGRGLAAGPLESPGRLGRHYAPRAVAVLIDAGEEASALASAVEGFERVAVLGGIALVRAMRESMGDRLVHAEPMPVDADGYARRLYAALHACDDAGAGVIVIERPRERGALWDAVRDRLSRATTA